MPTIKLKDGTTIEVSPKLQTKLTVMLTSEPDKAVRINGHECMLSDIETVDYRLTSMIEKIKAQGLNTDWYYKSRGGAGSDHPTK